MRKNKFALVWFFRHCVALASRTVRGQRLRKLKMDGMEKVMMGLTDLKQVRSACIK